MKLTFGLAFLALATPVEGNKRKEHNRNIRTHQAEYESTATSSTASIFSTTIAESALATGAAVTVKETKRQKHKEEKRQQHNQEFESTDDADEDEQMSLPMTYGIEMMKNTSKSGKSTMAPIEYSPSPTIDTPAPTTSSKSGKSVMPPASSKSGKADQADRPIRPIKGKPKCKGKKEQKCCNTAPSNRRMLVNCSKCRC